ncbi:MAG: hypothetical protein HZB55_20555 [Deltaproteobacteria bacterium]|nr:hypothetical protein [Deltaproteobacteria bacterium]
MAVSASHPLSEQDLDLICEVSRHTPEVAIILTKADLVSEPDLAAIVSFVRHQIFRQAPRNLSILPFSVLQAFEPLQSRFREYLRDRFVDGREERFETIVGHKVRTLATEAWAYLDLALVSATAEDSARRDLREALSRERREGGAVRGEVRVLIRDLETQARTAASERFHAYRGEVTIALRRRLENASPAWKGNLADTTRRFQSWLAEALSEELSRASGRGGESLLHFLDDALAQAHRAVRGFQGRLAHEIRRSLGVSFEGARFHAQVAEPARPDIRIGKTFDTNVDLLWFAIPMPLVRSWVQRHFEKLVSWEAEKNLSRLAAQWAEAVSASLEGLAAQTLDFMENELSSIGALVSGASDRKGEIRSALGELEALGRGVSGEGIDSLSGTTRTPSRDRLDATPA